MSTKKSRIEHIEAVDRIKADPQTFAFMSALAHLAESTTGLLNTVILDAVLVDDVPSFQEALEKFDTSMEVAVASRQAYLTWLEKQET